MPPKRKYVCGHDKRMKKKKNEELTQSLRGSLHKFLIKEPQISVENQDVDDVNAEIPENVDDVDDVNTEIPENVDDVNAEIPENVVLTENVNSVDFDVPTKNDNVDENDNLNNLDDDEEHDTDENGNNNEEQPTQFDYSFDIFDPRNWDALESKMIDLVVTKGPKRDHSIVKGPKDKFSRLFTAYLYTRVLSNGEKCDRDWLVYSKELDRVFCFCCKIFKKGIGRGQLTNDGFSDWSHIGERLKEHETGIEHVKNMTTWYELRLRLKKNETIDKTAQRLIEKEKDHWKNVLKRIVSIVKFLAKHSLAFRGSNEKLYQNSNGNFLGLIEMLAEFDPIIQEHVRRITNDNLHFHYLGHNIQNELIILLASAIKNEILKKNQTSKVFLSDT